MSAAEGVTLAGFLAARLDEDEAAAKACADNDGRLNWWDSRVMASGDHTIRTGSGSGGEGNRVVARIRRDDVEGDFGRLLDPDALASFIPRHDPARVLREVEAKRAILAAFLSFRQEFQRGDAGPALHTGTQVLRDVLGSLAAIWSDHPDYDPGWAA